MGPFPARKGIPSRNLVLYDVCPPIILIMCGEEMLPSHQEVPELLRLPFFQPVTS